jgi:hypothetical protein
MPSLRARVASNAFKLTKPEKVDPDSPRELTIEMFRVEL